MRSMLSSISHFVSMETLISDDFFGVFKNAFAFQRSLVDVSKVSHLKALVCLLFYIYEHSPLMMVVVDDVVARSTDCPTTFLFYTF